GAGGIRSGSTTRAATPWHNRFDRAPAQPVSPRRPLRRDTGMIGELSIGGVYVPSLLLFACAAVILTAVLSRLLSMVGFYRLVANRPLTHISLFFLLLAALVWVTAAGGLRP